MTGNGFLASADDHVEYTIVELIYNGHDILGGGVIEETLSVGELDVVNTSPD